MSTISLHLQSCPAWVPQFIERSGVDWLKWIDPPEKPPNWGPPETWPTWGVKVIGRTYEPDRESNERIWRGANGARSWFEKWAPFYDARPWIWCWESVNEPQPMADHTFRLRLNEFTVELAHLMHGAGLRLVGMNWGVGWPDIGHAVEMGAGVQACDYLGLHEYCAPAMWDGDGYYTLRYRRTVAELEAAGYTVPPLIIGECGIDGGVCGQPKTGWKTFCNGDFDRYLQQLQWYSRELDRDNVEAATIFTLCSWDWADFTFGESEAMALADWIASDNENGNGGEDPIMDVKVFDKDGVERDWQWAVDRYGVRLEEADPPEGATVYRLTELRQKVGPCGLQVKVIDESGAPLERIAVLQGWEDGTQLPDDAAPRLSETWWMQPDGKPNRGNGGFTNAEGDNGWGWGGGEQYDPATQEGAHWYWIMPGDDHWYSDVPLRFGWLFGSDHDHLDITFTRTTAENGNGNGNGDGDLVGVVEQLKRIADALESIEARWPFA